MKGTGLLLEGKELAAVVSNWLDARIVSVLLGADASCVLLLSRCLRVVQVQHHTAAPIINTASYQMGWSSPSCSIWAADMNT